jgi:hypothetical protein
MIVRVGPYPRTAAERVEFRRREETRNIEHLLRQLRDLGCSPKCSSEFGPRHAGSPDGCGNDGTGCLCWCHDRAAVGEQQGGRQ